MHIPTFRFNNMNESLPNLFSLLYGILVTYINGNKLVAGIKVYSFDKDSKGIRVDFKIRYIGK